MNINEDINFLKVINYNTIALPIKFEEYVVPLSFNVLMGEKLFY